MYYRTYININVVDVSFNVYVSVLYKKMHSYITQSDSDTIEVMFCDGPRVELVPYSTMDGFGSHLRCALIGYLS
jgi:hypothetical protein